MDVGCGTGQFLDYLRDEEFGGVLPASLEFVGVDNMEPSLSICRHKYPPEECPGALWTHLDLVEAAIAGAGAIDALPEVDYAVINGMFLAKAHLTQEDMMALVKRVVRLLWAKVRRGLAVNVFHDQVRVLQTYTCCTCVPLLVFMTRYTYIMVPSRVCLHISFNRTHEVQRGATGRVVSLGLPLLLLPARIDRRM